jgi:hypothetical protein
MAGKMAKVSAPDSGLIGVTVVNKLHHLRITGEIDSVTMSAPMPE